MLAIALVLEGWSRAEAAETCGMDRQTLRDWVHRSSTGLGRALASACTNARSASCCTSCRSGACRCARSIRRAILSATVFQAGFSALITAALPPEVTAKPVEIWFGDEARVGQQGTLTRVWARLTKDPMRVGGGQVIG
jgi:hypothetical protein